MSKIANVKPVPVNVLNDSQKRCILSCGMPASGKSTTLERLYGNLTAWTTLDCDKIKESLPNYDPKNPSTVHALSKKILKQQLEDTLSAGKNFIYDTTGTNIPRMINDIFRFKKLGYIVEVLFVDVSLSTSIYRNAHRERVVPLEILLETWEELPEAIRVLSPLPDKFTVVNND